MDGWLQKGRLEDLLAQPTAAMSMSKDAETVWNWLLEFSDSRKERSTR